MPNKKELESIVENCGSVPSVNQTVFPNTSTGSPFWSASTHVPTLHAWYVDFAQGGTDHSNKPNSGLFFRLVRGGQSYDSFDRYTLDFDGNGTADAQTDGLLVIRYLFGLRGAAMIQGAVGAGATRTAAEMETYLRSMLP